MTVDGDGLVRETAMDLRSSVELACILEATARKPGNVHPRRDFADLSYLELLRSAVAVGPVLARTPSVGIGASILDAVRATRMVSRSNSNLGILLLLTPLCALEDGCPIDAITPILDSLGVEDCRLVFQAIREARPGGLGVAAEHDVASEPTVGLVEAMRTAADRDTIARQYTIGFSDVEAVGVPALLAALEEGLGLEEAIVWCQLVWMAERPDSLIQRKVGVGAARESARRALAAIEAIGGPARTPAAGLLAEPRLVDLDVWLTEPGRSRNPGTSADLVAASLFWVLRADRVEWERVSFEARRR